MTTATRTHRTAVLSAEQRRARQDELLATLAHGVLELTTSDGWRRYLRAMATLRTYSTGNRPISEPREYPLCPAVMSSRVTVSGSSLADVGALLADCVVGESGAAPARHAVVDPIAGEIEASMRRCQRAPKTWGATIR